jgi:hypothetical protein
MSNVHTRNIGDQVNVEHFATIAGDSTYGFIPANFRTFTAGAGTAVIDNNQFKVTSGTTVADYGVIRSFRSVNYKTGQGANFRFSGRFDTPQDFSWSGLGGVNLGDELSFGYNGLNFGVWHRYHGKAEIQDLQITGAAGGSENATVTINSVAYTVPLTLGTVQKNAKEIADYLNANAPELEAEQINDIVRIDFISDGAKAGTYSFSSSTATGTWSQVTAGVTKTSDFYPSVSGVTQGVDATGVNIKEQWNGEEIPNFDPSKGQNYLIVFNNGFGNIEFWIEADNGLYCKVHTINWVNRETSPNAGNASLRVAMYATCIGNATAVDVYCTAMSGFIYGPISKTRNPRGFANTKSIDATLTNILTIRNSRTFNGNANQVEIEPLFAVLTNDTNNIAFFQIRGNPTVAGDTNFQAIGNNLVSQSDVAGTTVTEDGRLFIEIPVARLSSVPIDLTPFLIRQPPSLRLVIAGRRSSGSADNLGASLSWYEDV